MRSSPEKRLRDLLEAAPDAIIEVDENGKIQLLNGMTEKLFGYQREELVGQPVELLIPEELRAKHLYNRSDYLARRLTRPMGSGLSLQGRRKDGSCFPVEISLSPMKSGERLGAMAIMRDISERKKAEDQLLAIQEKYTHELQLRNREIERADRLKSEFLSSVSHELRTPLHTIIGFSELLAEDQQNLELVRVAFENGSVSRVDVLTAQSQLATDEVLLPPLRQQLTVARHALAVLAGRAPDWTVPAAGVLFGITRGFTSGSFFSALAEIAGPELLDQASAIEATSRNLAVVIGPARSTRRRRRRSRCDGPGRRRRGRRHDHCADAMRTR